MKKETRIWLWVISIIVVLLILARFLIPIAFGYEYPMYSHMFTGMMFPIGIFGMLLFWGLVIYIVYVLLIRENGIKNKKNEDELDILRKRLSKGEITIEEYEKIKETLKEDK